eukprot:TRINITY_DN66678_c2_g1_i1.p1 TRINITY_DN66678_c2_g1~~TRINITY_DN66678_c2_g1_i1.p1  ORF type:complete len:400 (-),score=30.37 TRINITY_DN66678_c2_g1_i1:347-1420(-)
MGKEGLRYSTFANETAESLRAVLPANGYVVRPHMRGGATAFSVSPLDVARLPVVQFPGRVVIVRSAEDDFRARNVFREETLIGLDTEWRPELDPARERNPTAIIQISSATTCVLYMVNLIGLLPESLVAILEDSAITKVAHGAKHELAALRKEFNVVPANLVDLHHIALVLRCRSRSLQALTAIFMGRQLRKNERLSDWASDTLTKDQVMYAATDAWLSREVLLAMRRYFNVPVLSCEKPCCYTSEDHSNKPNVKENFSKAAPATAPATPPTTATAPATSGDDSSYSNSYTSSLRKSYSARLPLTHKPSIRRNLFPPAPDPLAALPADAAEQQCKIQHDRNHQRRKTKSAPANIHET